MSQSSSFQDANDDIARSRFTYRDLRLLSQSSVTSPLRVIALVDFDCFYAQCEAVRLGLPNTQPLGVQQFKHVIAINYPARAAGLKKVVTAVEAKQKCPNIVLQHVPTWREGDTTWAYRDDALDFMDSDKSSLDYYRLQSRKAIAIVKGTLPLEPAQRIEKAGIDEVFLDLSAQVHGILMQRHPELSLTSNKDVDSQLPQPSSEILDWADDRVFGTDEPDEDLRVPDWNDVALSIGAEIVRNLRQKIHTSLKYTCSAGIARNKVIAKLAAGHNKPNKQTIIRDNCIASFLSAYKFTKLRGLGGKLGGKAVKSFGTDLVSELLKIPQNKMQSELGPESGLWVYRAIRGIEHSQVSSRTQVQSMLSAKTFTPNISSMEQAERWLLIFAADIMGRVEEQEGRRPKTIAVHYQPNGRFGPTRSKQAPIPLGAKLDAHCLSSLSKNVLVDIIREGASWPCLTLSIAVSDFFDTDTTSQSLTSFWVPQKHEDRATMKSPSSERTDEVYTLPIKPKKRTLFDYQDRKPPSGDLQPTNDIQQQDVLLAKKRHTSASKSSNGDEKIDINISRDTEGKYQCPNCNDFIPAEGVLEHLDWHVALDFQNQ